MVATQSLPGLCLETTFQIRTGLGKQTKKKTLDKVRGRSGIWLNLNKKILGFKSLLTFSVLKRTVI